MDVLLENGSLRIIDSTKRIIMLRLINDPSQTSQFIYYELNDSCATRKEKELDDWALKLIK